jgi:hypothetical protein
MKRCCEDPEINKFDIMFSVPYQLRKLFIRQVLMGLLHLHRHGVAHGGARYH